MRLSSAAPGTSLRRITALLVALFAILVVSGSGTTPATAGGGYQPDPQVVADVWTYAQETEHGYDHVLRWFRVLSTFGALEGMTAAQAQGYADTYSAERWDPVVAELTAMENAQGSHQPDQQVIADVRSYAQETQHGYDHVLRWFRVLSAFGALEDMTAAQAQGYADTYSAERWNPVVAELTAMEANSPATGAPTITGTARVGETLMAGTSSISDADGLDNATFSYQWLADDADLSGATSSTYTLADADEGKAVKVRVSFTDDDGNDETLTSAATNAVAPRPNSPATGAPTITGTARVGETLTADTSGISDADGLDNATFSYQWLADDADVSGATGSTYTLADADEGKAVKVRVSFTDDDGNDETLTSAATNAVAAATPATEPPATPSGLTATATAGSLEVAVDWDDVDGAANYLVRWRRHGPDQDLNDGVRPTSSETQITVASHGSWVVRVEACNDAGCGTASAVRFDVEESTAPGQPANLSLADVDGKYEVAASWDATDRATAYRLGWRPSDGSPQPGGTLDVTETSATVEVAGSGQWQVWVQACNDGGCGDPATGSVDVASVTAAQQRNVVGEQETTTTLVSNTGQTPGAGVLFSGSSGQVFWQNAQGFTTGASFATLTEVDLRLHSAGVGSAATPRVSIYSSSSGSPGSSLYVLTNPGSFTANAVNTFTAPADSTLDANTTYFVVIETTATTQGSSNQVNLSPASSSADDSGGQTGWSIANSSYQKRTTDNSWSPVASAIFMIALRGEVGAAAISNTGQAAEHTDDSMKPAFSNDNAQGFTTGSHAQGYTLTAVDFRISITSGTPAWAIALEIRKPDANGRPGGDLVGTLTNPSDFSASVDRFTHAGLALDADTTYFAAIDVDSSTTTSGGSFVLESTTSDDEDSAGLAGWSIANKRWARTASNTSWAAADEEDSALKIAVMASETPDTTAPVALRAGLNPLRNTIAITFDEPLKTDAPAAGQFSLQDSSGTDIASTTPSSVSVAGSVVTATFGSIPSSAAQIKYAPSSTATDNPLQDASGNQTAAFSQAYSEGLLVVGNTGQAAGGAGLVNRDYRLPFTTGDHPGDYKLTRVDIDLTGTGSVPTYAVELRDSSEADLATFTNPSSLTDGLNSFTLSTAHDLAADTTYYIVLDQSSASASFRPILTSSNEEEDGAAPGWSISNTAWDRDRTTIGWGHSNLKVRLALYAYELDDTTAPTASRAVLNGTAKTVTVTFSEELKTDAPAAAQFSLQDNSGTDIASTTPSSVSISGKVVTATFSSIPSNAARIKYTPSSTAGDNPLQDRTGNPAAAFSLQAVVLVSNIGQAAEHTNDETKPAFTRDNAQAFTTGSHGGGYSLTGVGFQISIRTGFTPTWDMAVEVRKADADGRPGGDLVGTLTNPSGFGAGVDRFTHTGLELEADTTYFALIDVKSATTERQSLVLESTTSDDEDAGGLAGWSIGNKRWARTFNSTAWAAADEKDSALRVRLFASELPHTTASSATVDRTAKTVTVTFSDNLKTDTPAAAQFTLQDSSRTDIASTTPTSVSISGAVFTATFSSIPSNAARIKYTPSSTASDNPLQGPVGNQVAAFSRPFDLLMSNTRRALSTDRTYAGWSDGTRIWLAAMGFTTGGEDATLTHVDIRLHSNGVGSAATPRVSIYSSSGGNPDSSLYVLNNPSSFTADAINTFTAPANSTLDANTTYFVVIETTATTLSADNRVTMNVTANTAKDPDGQSGWTIANSRLTRRTTQTTWSTGGTSLLIALRGTVGAAATPPAVGSALLNRSARTLAITFDEDLDTATPSAAQFALQDSSGNDITSTTPSSVAVGGKVVTLTFGSIPANAAKIKYTPSAADSDNPLQDAEGNKVASFSQAFTFTPLVSNTDQADEHTVAANKPAFSRDNAQAFTTGSNATGYTLTHVDMEITQTADPGTLTYTMQIRKAGSSGRPGGDLVGTMTNPADFSGAVDRFTHTGLVLEANTTYFAVLEVTAATSGGNVVLESTTSDDEDPGSASGWSISNKRWARAFGTGGWADTDEKDSALQVAVYGRANPPRPVNALLVGSKVIVTFSHALNTTPPAAARFSLKTDGAGPAAPQSVEIAGADVTLTWATAPSETGALTLDYSPPGNDENPLQDTRGKQVVAFMDYSVTRADVIGTLVSNVTRSDGSQVFHQYDVGQTFDTGSNPSGYTLTAVQIQLVLTGSNLPSYEAEIWSVDANGRPANKLATLTKPDSLTSGVNTFTISSPSGIELDATTGYAVLFDLSSAGDHWSVRNTTSLDEDPDAARGWTIRNQSLFRNRDSGGGWSTFNEPRKIAVVGSANGPAGFDYAYLNGSTSLVVVFDEALDQNSRPAAGSFTVSRDGTDAAASGIAFLGGKAVRLTFSSAFTSGQTVTVSYAKPTANPLQNLAGNEVGDFSKKPVTNTLGDATAPSLHTAVVDGDTLTLTYDETLNEFSTPAASAFRVRVDGSAVSLAAADPVQVASNGTTVTLTLASAVTGDQTVTVSYTRPGSNRLEDLRGNDSANLANRNVGHASDATAPAVDYAYVNGASSLLVVFDEELDQHSVPAAGSFTVSRDGTTETASGIAMVGGKAVRLTFSSAFTSGQTVTVSYVEPTTNPLQDLAGNAVADFSGQSATNTAGDTTAPALSSAVVEAATLTLTYDETLNEFSVPAASAFTVKVDGSAVNLAAANPVQVASNGTTVTLTLATAVTGTQAVTVSYTRPGSNRLEDLAGNDAANLTDRTAFNRPAVVLAYGSPAPTRDANLDGRAETYVESDSIKVKVRFSEAVTVANRGSGGANIQVVLDVGGTEHTLNHISTSNNYLEFGTRTVASADQDTDGITIKRDGSDNLVRLSGTATIKSSSTSRDAHLAASADLGVRADADNATLLALVRGTNAAPTGTDFTATAQKDVALTLARTDFAITDSEGDALKEIRVVTLPDSAHGELKLDGTAIPSGDLPKTVSRGDLEQGKLVFQPALEYIGQASFTFKVVDSFGAAAASANTATINVIPGPPLLTAVAHGRTLALVYEEPLDESSVPAAADFTVKVDGSEVGLTNSNPVRVNGPKVTLTLASSVTGANMVTLSYTKGTNPIRSAANENDAADLVDQAVSTAAPAIRSAVINRAGTTMTIRLSEGLLEGSFVRTDWRYRTDNGGWRYPTGGSFDADEGTVILTFSTPVTWSQSLNLLYNSRQLRNAAGNPLAMFSNREVPRHVPPNAACTMGPGPDPRNPDSPCGTGPHDPTTEPGAYKSINDHTQAEANQPPHPKYVRIDCSNQHPTSCTIKFKGWTATETYTGYHDGQVLTLAVGGHTYKTYVWTDLGQDPESAVTCSARSHLAQSFIGIWDHTHFGGNPNFEATHGVSLSTPNDLPSGCVVKRWVAAVNIVRSSDRSHSGSTLAFREP